MEKEKRSPRIEGLSWGRLQVAGHEAFKDAKLFPGGARSWNWRETGTEHEPGIQPGDVDELLAYGAAVVVLSQGMTGRLQIAPETSEFLEARGIPCHVLRTEEAVRVYNELAEKDLVGGLFHTTC